MKKANLLVAAFFAGLGVRAQAMVLQPAAGGCVETVKVVEAKKSWSRVQVKLGKAARKPVSGNAVAWDLPKPPRNPHPVPTCGVRG